LNGAKDALTRRKVSHVKARCVNELSEFGIEKERQKEKIEDECMCKGGSDG
jgi:hypothetical protein